MNDLEHDLRTLLEDKATGAGAPEPHPALLRRARRRQLGTVLGSVAVAAALVAGVAIGVRTLAPADRHTPLEPSEPLVDTNINGITVTHPESWYVVDPAEAGIETGSNDLPRLVLFVSDTDPMASGTLGCPGLGTGATDGFVLTLQQEPLALAGEAAQGWPVDLAPLDTGNLGEFELDPSPCYPGWAFRRASWTSGGRTFEARVGVGPDASGVDRRALDAAFASLRFAPTEIGPDAVVIATGTAGGEDWELIAYSESDGLALTLQWSSGGVGIGGIVASNAAHLGYSGHAFGTEGDLEVVAFGTAGGDVARVEVTPAGGEPIADALIDVPESIGGPLDAWLVTYRPVAGDTRARLRALDRNGEPLLTVPISAPPGGG